MNTFLVRWIAIYAFENVDDCFFGFYKLDFWFRGPKRIASFQRLIKSKSEAHLCKIWEYKVNYNIVRSNILQQCKQTIKVDIFGVYVKRFFVKTVSFIFSTIGFSWETNILKSKRVVE